MYWSPYRPTFQLLEKTDSPSGQSSPDLEHVVVTASVLADKESRVERKHWLQAGVL